MTLRHKTLFITGVTLVTLIFALYTASSHILLDGFNTVEDKSAAATIGRVQSGFKSLVDDLDTIATDYAHWDATYQFVTDSNQSYIKETLNKETIASLRINLIAYVDNAGRVVWGKAFDARAWLSVITV